MFADGKMKIMRLFLLLIFGVFVSILITGPVEAERLKDIASLEGFRGNQIIGYGLVAGINGDGDKGLATMQGLANVIARLGITVVPKEIQSKNVAAVIVTATLPPFPKPGLRLDAQVSTLGDAKTLQGGILLLTPLKGPDQKVYGLAQGAVSIGGFSAGGGGTGVQKNHPTTGRVPNGVIIERGLEVDLVKGNMLHWVLHNPDFTTAFQVAGVINQKLGSEVAEAVDPSLIKVKVPGGGEFLGGLMGFISQIEAFEVPTDTLAKVVINERTGTVVMGDKVRLSPVAIAHGNLTIEVTTDYKVSQPAPFAPPSAQTVVVPQTKVDVKEQKASLMEVSGTTLGEIVRALNQLGVTPRDLIAILQSLKSAGALKVELEIL
jgi:flagellar P-ring protein FlgI